MDHKFLIVDVKDRFKTYKKPYISGNICANMIKDLKLLKHFPIKALKLIFWYIIIHLIFASNCLLDRMHQCGEGARMAAKTREWSAWMEEVMKKEREVQWLAKLREGQLVHKGRFLVSDWKVQTYPTKFLAHCNH